MGSPILPDLPDEALRSRVCEIEQSSVLASFWVRHGQSVRRLLCLVNGSLGRLNVWRKDGLARLREALLRHPWRLPRGTICLFDWIGQILDELRHPHPKIPLEPG